jgi:hypothetical protein
MSMDWFSHGSNTCRPLHSALLMNLSLQSSWYVGELLSDYTESAVHCRFWHFVRIVKLKKVTMSLCLIKTLCHEDIWGRGGIAPLFLTSAASRPGLFTPGERFSGTHWIGDWVGLRLGLNAVERKILHCRESNQGRPVRSPSLYRLSYRDCGLWNYTARNRSVRQWEL